MQKTSLPAIREGRFFIMGQTSHYKWKQPEPWERTEHRDYAKTISAIDTAVAAKADSSSVNSRFSTLETELDSRFTAVDSSIRTLEARPEAVVGTYTGDGAENRVISLGVTPKLVLVEFPDGTRNRRGGMAIAGAPMIYSGDIGIEIVDGGFRVTIVNYVEMNVLDAKYYYLALC